MEFFYEYDNFDPEMKKYTDYCVIDETCYKLQMYTHVSKISILFYIALALTKCLLIALKFTLVCVDIEVSHLEGTIQLNPSAAKSKNTDYMHYLFWIRYFNAVLTRVVTDHMSRLRFACHKSTSTVVRVVARQQQSYSQSARRAWTSLFCQKFDL